MSKLSRVFQNIFGLNGDQSHFGQFGSRVIAPPGLKTKDPSSIQSLSAFTGNGLKDAINSGNKAAFLEDLNGLFLLAFRQVAYLFQAGIAEWDPSTPYFTGSIVTAPGTSQLYGSLVDNNTGNALPNQTNNASWQYLNPQSVDPGTIIPYAGSIIPAGKLLCDGTSYPQATYPGLYAAIAGAGWDTFNGAASPGAGNFRVPDLRGLTLIGVGHGNGFTARTLAQLLGEEAHVLSTGEMPSHNHPLTDPQHTHGEGTSAGINAAAGGNGPFVEASGSSFITSPASTGITIGNTGGGGSHNNMQPSAGINYLIKT